MQKIAFIRDNQLNDSKTPHTSVLVESIEEGDVAICQHLFAIIEAFKQDKSNLISAASRKMLSS